MPVHNDNLLLRLYKSMFFIRHAEEQLVEIYKEQIIRTPAHFGLGQEAVAVGTCQALVKGDLVYSHHRCHNHYLAQNGNFYRLVCELLGREDGCSKGRGGSVHLTDINNGFVASSAILGQTVAVGTGSALAFKMDKKRNVAVVFFGDAVLEEGVFWESLNYATIHKLPVLLVCENNGYSTESPGHVRQAPGTTLSKRVDGFNVSTKQVNGNDVSAVYEATCDALEKCRNGEGPYFIECRTYRWLEHVGPFFDHEFDRSYRSQEELNTWFEKDPLKLCKNTINEEGLIEQNIINEAEEEIKFNIKVDIEKARKADWPSSEGLFENVY
jgi:TPP-dependent pyruvate/acetoin dehydrogenase alpha subunit